MLLRLFNSQSLPVNHAIWLCVVRMSYSLTYVYLFTEATEHVPTDCLKNTTKLKSGYSATSMPPLAATAGAGWFSTL